MTKFLVFIIGTAISLGILVYRRQVKEFFGDIAIAERILGPGGTNTFFVLIAILIFIGSMMYALGTLQGVIQSTIGRIF